MSRILAILLLILSAWVLVPGAAQAHEAAPKMAHAMACDACADMAGAAQGDHAKDCLHGAGCLGYVLVPQEVSVTVSRLVVRIVRPHTPLALSSVSLRLDVPPPRA
ncbi:hypothetical protein [Pseudooceanicola nanhaiensis]|uniref:hypothetical protein n=1 Tax=Pseudooceanicola nanhaiensis TaxID=375761 RepID=UPI001CD69A30|nr:hypothetical protein [Pseudooceanicola nanhaiensis]MCA0920659.1 hypothetical protein [Pseudooceanicola nanhaiensis]